MGSNRDVGGNSGKEVEKGEETFHMIFKKMEGKRKGELSDYRTK